MGKTSYVFYTGSYALNLMVLPDIDIEISMHNDSFNKEIFFEIGKQISQLPDIISMKFKDHHAFPVDSLPAGLYWNIRIHNDFHDIPWKIDLWAFNQQQIENNMIEIQRIKNNLNEENRKLIIIGL